MPRFPSVAVVLLCSVALVPEPCDAYPFHSEEYERKVDEVASLADRGLYSAAEGKFAAVVRNDDYQVGPELYLIGAQLARATGNVALMKERLSAAVELGAEDDADGWLEQIRLEYAPVAITDKSKDMAELAAAPPPFNPDHAAAISFARAELLMGGKFEGYLPLGHYVIANATFDVERSEDTLEVRITRKGERKGVLAEPQPQESKTEAEGEAEPADDASEAEPEPEPEATEETEPDETSATEHAPTDDPPTDPPAEPDNAPGDSEVPPR